MALDVYKTVSVVIETRNSNHAAGDHVILLNCGMQNEVVCALDYRRSVKRIESGGDKTVKLQSLAGLTQLRLNRGRQV
jgi:hypothetical protein